MNAIQLIRVGFDDLENHNPIRKEVVGLFTEIPDGTGRSAHGKIADWFDKLGPVKLHLGYNGQVYPQFEMKEIRIQ